MSKKQRKPFIFIVYEKSELELGDALKNLFEAWGYDAFHCRQEEKQIEAYRKELRENICKCDLVVLLLSRDFRWSPYCQAEAGSTIVLEKPFVAIIVSPATLDEIVADKIAPVLEDYDYIFTNDPDFARKLEGKLRSALAESKTRLTQLVSRLQALKSEELQLPTIVDDSKLEALREKIDIANKKVEENYLSQPKKAITSTWPSLADPDCKESIVGNIRRSLEDRTRDTILVFVGVSLKFSLDLIATALDETRKPATGKTSSPKKLRITLVHMESESHILHAMEDDRDIRSIRDNFDDINWPKVYDTWKELCGFVSIELEPPILHQIDYIPPRVGLMIDDEYLYAGRCSFRLIGEFDVPMKDVHTNAPPRAGSIPRFNLDVGENEYQFHKRDKTTRKTDPAYRAMREFKGSVVAYRQPKFNAGIRPIWESHNWITELRRHITTRTHADEITFVSATSHRFEDLIRLALRVGATVSIFHHDSSPDSKEILNLRTNLGVKSTDERIAISGYAHSPTFRAVIVGDVAIGLQPYTSADIKSEGPEMPTKLPLCLIITRRFNKFAELKNSILNSLKK